VTAKRLNQKPCIPVIDDGAQLPCSRCERIVSPEKAYAWKTAALCEECCMDLRTVRTRKTHWQYIGSIKADYLVLAAVDANVKQKSSCSGN
jgi:hypothetical protein